MTSQCDELEVVMIKLFNHLKDGFSLVDPKDYKGWERPAPPQHEDIDSIESKDRASMADPTRVKVHEFERKISELLPTVKKALRLVMRHAPGMFLLLPRRLVPAHP